MFWLVLPQHTLILLSLLVTSRAACRVYLKPEGSEQGKALQGIHSFFPAPVISAAWGGFRRLKLELRREKVM